MEFRQKQENILHRVGTESYSVEIFEPGFEMMNFTPLTPFEKWAAVKVSEADNLPEGFEVLTIPEGNYARFIYKGLHAHYPAFAQYIFGEWLPDSGYQLDDRPHFEVMGENYFGPMNPDSEEEIWIPIK